MYSQISYRNYLIITFFCLSRIPCMMAQAPESDTSGIIEKIVEKADTLVLTPVSDSVVRRWADRPIDSMLFRNNNTRFKKELYNLIIRSGDSAQKTPVAGALFAAMEGLTIRNIRIRHVDMFAPSVTDTFFKPAGWFGKIANSSHNDTRKSVLNKYLLLKPGDRLDVFQAAENERILRDLPFIMDAAFIAVPVKGSQDSIDLVLVTQDKLPFGFDAQIEKTTLASFAMWHHNVLGYGHQFSAITYMDFEHSPHVGYRLSYGSANMGGTFTAGRVEYINRWNQETFLMDVSRDFKVMSLISAGGFTFENSSLTRNIDMLDTVYQDARFRYSGTDIWLGRIISPLMSSSMQSSSGLYITGRYKRYNNISGPSINDAYLYPFSNRSLALFSVGLSRQGSVKDNLIYTFGRTEDVPYGYRFEMTSGAEWNTDVLRPYISFGAAYGTFFRNSAYLSGQVRYGTFFNQGNAEQGTFRLQTTFFSRLREYKRFQFRNFFDFTYVKGFDRYPGEFVSISNQLGITGLSSLALRGQDKMVLNLESVIFSPYKLFGFRFAFFGGVDLGLVTFENKDIYSSKLYSGINAGVRIRNDQLVFDTFVIKFSVYPGRPDDGSAQNFIIDHVPRIRFDNFLPGKPELVEYQ